MDLPPFEIVYLKSAESPIHAEPKHYLPETRYVGEIGLDAGPRYYRSIDLQRKVFERMLRLCERAGDKILSVHCVRAASAVLDLVELYLPRSRGHIVLHWFTGSRAESRRAIDLGCYFSVNASMLMNNNQRYLVVALPVDRILTETDGPFCKHEGRPVHPRDSEFTTKLLVNARGMGLEETAVTILSNFHNLETS